MRALLYCGAAQARSELTAIARPAMARSAQARAQRPQRRAQVQAGSDRAGQVNGAAAGTRVDGTAYELEFADMANLPQSRHATGWPVARIETQLGSARGLFRNAVCIGHWRRTLRSRRGDGGLLNGDLPTTERGLHEQAEPRPLRF